MCLFFRFYDEQNWTEGMSTEDTAMFKHRHLNTGTVYVYLSRDAAYVWNRWSTMSEGEATG